MKRLAMGAMLGMMVGAGVMMMPCTGRFRREAMRQMCKVKRRLRNL